MLYFLQAIGRHASKAPQAFTPNYYSTLDTKGLAICDDRKYIADAIEAFHAARKIAPHTGIVKRNLRLFDELVKCDEEGILKDVRKAVEGKPLVE